MKIKIHFKALFWISGILMYCNSVAQSPAVNASLNAPFEPITRISLGMERGIGYGGIKNFNFNGLRSILDFVSYKFDFAMGITQSETGKNSLSINTVITKNLNETNIDAVAHYCLFSGFGYTKLYSTESLFTEQLNIPFGLGLGLDGPLPTIDVNLSISFRGQYRMLQTMSTNHVIGYGINVGGVFSPSAKNLGIRINYDFLNIKNGKEAKRMFENGLSVGFQYIIY